MAADLTFTHSVLGLTQIEGNSPEAIEFVDAYITAEMHVDTTGRIIVPTRNAPAVEKTARRLWLTVEHDLVRDWPL